MQPVLPVMQVLLEHVNILHGDTSAGKINAKQKSKFNFGSS